MTKLILQDSRAEDIKTVEIDRSAPMVVQYNSQYYYRHFMRKNGDSLYRPASFHRVIED